MEILLPSGTIEYREEGDPDGPPVVLLHGLLMNDTQWDLALPHLPAGYRYLLPVLPIGGHRIPMRDDADLTMPGMVDVAADFLDALDLTDVTLVVSDWGGPLFLTDVGRDKRIARLVICPSEAYDNFPPGFPGKVTWVGTRTTGTVKMAMQQLRIGWLRRRFFLFGMMAAKPIPSTSSRRGRIRESPTCGFAATCSSTHGPGSTSPRSCARPTGSRTSGDVLVLWSRNRVMPVAHAEALAELTGGTLRYVDDAKVLIMLDQPEETARAIGEFLKG